MRLGALAFQATIVIGVTATVGYPEFRRPARPIVVWRAAGPLTPRPDLVASDPRLAYGITAASLPLSGPSSVWPDAAEGLTSERRRTSDAATRGIVPVSGSVRTALYQPVPFAYLSLRNVRTGRIESRLRADKDGLFDFGLLVRGSYVVEMLGGDGSVIAASEVTGPGALAGSTNIRLSGNATPRALFGAAGDTLFLTSTASEPLSRAAESGIQQTTGPDATASPRN